MRSTKPEFFALSREEEYTADALWEMHEISERHAGGWGSIYMKALDIIKRLEVALSKKEEAILGLEEQIEELTSEEAQP